MKTVGLTLKLLRRVLIAELMSLLIILAVAVLFLRPKLKSDTILAAEKTGAILAADVEQSLVEMSSFADFALKQPELIDAPDKTSDSAALADVYVQLDRLCATAFRDVRCLVYLSDGVLLVAGEELTENDWAYLCSSWLATLFYGAEPGRGFTSLYSAEDPKALDTIIYAQTADNLSGRRCGIVGIYDATGLLESIREKMAFTCSGYVIASAFGPSFLRSGTTGNSDAILDANRHAGDAYVVSDGLGYYFVNALSNDWRICCFVSNHDLFARFQVTMEYILGMCLLLGLISLLIVLPLARKTVRPAAELQRAMSRAAEGDLTVCAEIGTQDELGRLADYFNYMIGRMREHEELKKQEQQMRYSLLRSQLNTHFICNTMSSINSLARMGDYARILSINTALLNILRATLSSQDGEMVTRLSDELELLKQYWQIGIMKNGAGIELVIDVPPALRESVIPRNILQPVVENSLRHGLTDMETGVAEGVVTISAEKEKNALLLRVSDNGNGIDEESLQQLEREAEDDELRERGCHIGLSALRKLLRFLYRDEAHLTIGSDGAGTVVTIEIPTSE